MDITKLKQELRGLVAQQGAIIRGQSFSAIAAAALAEIERLESALADCERGNKPRKPLLSRGGG
jgi:hypothetical protein